MAPNKSRNNYSKKTNTSSSNPSSGGNNQKKKFTGKSSATSGGGGVSKREKNKSSITFNTSRTQQGDARSLLTNRNKGNNVMELDHGISPRFIGRLEAKPGNSDAKPALVTKSFLEKQKALSQKPRQQQHQQKQEHQNHHGKKTPSFKSVSNKIGNSRASDMQASHDKNPNQSLTITISNDAKHRAQRNPAFELPPPVSSMSSTDQAPLAAYAAAPASNAILVTTQPQNNWVPRHMPIRNTAGSTAILIPAGAGTTTSTGGSMMLATTAATRSLPMTTSNSSHLHPQTIQLVSTANNGSTMITQPRQSTRTATSLFTSLLPPPSSSQSTNATMSFVGKPTLSSNSTVPSLNLSSRFAQMYS